MMTYTIFVLLAGIMWGCMGLLVRPLNDIGMQSMDIVALRSYVTFALVALTSPVLSKLINSSIKKDIRIRCRDWWVFAGTGIVSIVFFNFCYFNTIMCTSLSVAAIMLYTAPVFVMLISVPVFGHRISKKKICCLFLAVVGCCFVTGVLFGNTTVNGRGILFGLGAGIGYALYSIFGKIATSKGYNSVTVTFYTFLLSSIGVLPFTDMEKMMDFIKSDYTMILYALCFIVVTTYLPYIFYTAGLKGMEPGKASVIACIEPVSAAIVGCLVYKESINIESAIGITLVIIAIFFINREGQAAEK